MPDILTALLRHVRIETSLFGRVELGAPWGARVGQRDTVLVHYLLEGEMWLELDGRELRAGPGDILVLPHGVPHCLRHRPGAPVTDEASWGTPPMPGTQSVRRQLGGSGARTVVLCAAMSVLGAGRALLLRALPSVVHIGADAGESVPGFERLLDGIREEVHGGRPGAPQIAARFAELLLLQAIRVELERPGSPGSWRAALTDERLARALDGLYRAPARAWTVATLAREAGMSRAGFAHTFRTHVGETPLRHLTRWRMELAKETLRAHPDRALADVASSAGYRNEAAFSVAFRREVGVPPGAYRAAVIGGSSE